MHFHWQNLNDRPGDRRGSTGNPFWQGRWWLSFGELLTISFTWFFKSSFCHARIGVACNDEDLGFSIALPPVAFWLHFEGKLTRWSHALRGKGEYDGRKTELSIHDWAFWGSIWAREHSWSRDDPWWMHWHLDFADLVLGKNVHSAEALDERDVRIPMPEGAYEAKAIFKRETWKRSRWPWPLVITRLHLEIPGGVPVPGKGENSWDCGPDATYGTTGPAQSIEEGIGRFVGSTLALRKRRGGRDDYSDRPKPPKKPRSQAA